LEKGIEKRILSVDELATYVNLSRATVYRYMRKGTLPQPINNNARWGWDKKVVDEKMDQISGIKRSSET
jgi:predicted DNA-binding transcriptional regulator AlpA